jgi:hypothetical protein
MKNLMTFANPAKFFVDHYDLFVRMQIDNTLEMGWSQDDIMLVTNFPYEYRGVEAVILDDSTYCEHRKRASKINMICELIKQDILNDVAWFHDFDAWQAEPLSDVLDKYDAAFTDYGTNAMWNTGSFFFKPSSVDLFCRIREVMNNNKINEEIALKYITNNKEFKGRYFKINGTYNHGRMRNTDRTYAAAEKPIKVFHFDPRMNDLYHNVKPLLPIHLNSLFEHYGFLC